MNSAEAGATSARRKRRNSIEVCRFKMESTPQPPEERVTTGIPDTYRLKINVKITMKRDVPGTIYRTSSGFVQHKKGPKSENGSSTKRAENMPEYAVSESFLRTANANATRTKNNQQK